MEDMTAPKMLKAVPNYRVNLAVGSSWYVAAFGQDWDGAKEYFLLMQRAILIAPMPIKSVRLWRTYTINGSQYGAEEDLSSQVR